MSGAEHVVLYDVPGPRARRRALVGSVVTGTVLLAVALVVLVRLADAGQFSARRWGPLIDPSTPQFPQVWRLIGQGLGNTLIAAALAITLSLAVGTVLGVARLMTGRRSRIPLVGVTELLRGLPVVITIFFAYRVLPSVGVDVSGLPGEDGLWYLLIGLTVYNGVVIAEILRAGVLSLPRGQREAGLSLGLTPWQTMRLVLLPPAFRVMLPALVSQLVVVLKDTSLAGLLGLYSETLRQSIRISQLLGNPLQMYFVIGVIFILLNGALSQLATRLERSLAGPTAPSTRRPLPASAPRHRPPAPVPRLRPGARGRQGRWNTPYG
jgi:glutamate transport system permease protein